MIHPEKWRDTEDPFRLPYRHFTLTKVIGYPHAGNDVFQALGTYQGRDVEVYIKVARQAGADIKNEIRTIRTLNHRLAPQIIDADEENGHFLVTLARGGERLSTIVGDNKNCASMNYLYEYGQTLARLHSAAGSFPPVKDRKFFHMPDRAYLEENGLDFLWDYLSHNTPAKAEECFCHGDFHYANLLWENGHISAILDFELSGIGRKEFDIAWALILRPDQKFLKTQKEQDLFLEGYHSAGTCNLAAVRYFMALIYSRFFKIGASKPEYQEYVADALHKIINTPPTTG